MDQSLAAKPHAKLKSTVIKKKRKRVLLILTAVLLVLASNVVIARSPRIIWSPDPLVLESIAPGEEVPFTVSLTNIGFLPIPAAHKLQVITKGDAAQYISVTQPSFPRVFKRGDEVSFDVTVSVPDDAESGIKDGKFVLKRLLRNSKYLKVWRVKSLPVALNIKEISTETVVDESSGASISIPLDLTATQKERFLLVGSLDQDVLGLPPTFAMYVYDVPEDIAALPHDEALREVSMLRLDPRDVISEEFHHGGLEISARTFERHHFFIYDPVRKKAVEFSSGYEGVFGSTIFLDALESLSI